MQRTLKYFDQNNSQQDIHLARTRTVQAIHFPNGK